MIFYLIFLWCIIQRSVASFILKKHEEFFFSRNISDRIFVDRLPVFTGSPSAGLRGFFPSEKFSGDSVKAPLARQILGFTPAEFTSLYFPDGSRGDTENIIRM